jgi:peptidylprolyl isomerase
MVRGVGGARDLPPDTGSGAELYLVIGHGPRHLDCNIALIGRVLAGGEALASLPRGTGALGVHEAPEAQVKLHSAALARDLPEADRPRFEGMGSDSAAMAARVAARASRRDSFFVRPAGAAGICNLLPPTRRSPDWGAGARRGCSLCRGLERRERAWALVPIWQA